MVDLFRDAARLEILTECPLGLERLEVVSHLKDFYKYYFSRFLTNLTHVFKDFKHSEIEAFQLQKGRRIALLHKTPLVKFKDTIVPVPRGMIGSYRETLYSIEGLLADVSSDRLLKDLSAFTQAIGNDSLNTTTLASYTKDQFESAKSTLSGLFSKNGLSHKLAGSALQSVEEISQVTHDLSSLTKTYYPEVLALNGAIPHLEEAHHKEFSKGLILQESSALLMSLAWRLSIFAICLDHIQTIEHAFVQTLDILLKQR